MTKTQKSGFMQPEYLPVSKKEMDRLGWDEIDVLLVSGDAYVDHPSFGTALLGRSLVSHGFRVGIIPQPRWDNQEDIKQLGRPRLFAGITAGALDSMLAHYTAFRKKRSDDAYTPGGKAGARPNRASIVYTNMVKQAFPGLHVVLGGIEASLRRISHYDFWSDKVRRSILLDSKADLICYGMAERAILEITRRLEENPGAGMTILEGIKGTAIVGRKDFVIENEAVVLPSHEDILKNPEKLMEATLALERQVHDADKLAVQMTGDRMLVINPPAEPLTADELDRLYALPYSKAQHPSYQEPVPALEMIASSITSHRGCGGGCSFCSLALHQGRRIRSRSRRSILDEVRSLSEKPEWKGSISDIGGPSANMWGGGCSKEYQDCLRPSCLFPDVCPHFEVDQSAIMDMLYDVAKIPEVKHVRVASGIRFDLSLKDQDSLKALVNDFVGGQLKIAPEHLSKNVLKLMRKPGPEPFYDFLNVFERQSRKAGKEQYIIPYFMSAFPGCTDQDMRSLADWLRSKGWKPRQVQCFIPTPGTVATAMYYAGTDHKGNRIHVARTDAERLRQHRILIPEEKKFKKKAGKKTGAKVSPGKKPKPKRRS